MGAAQRGATSKGAAAREGSANAGAEVWEAEGGGAWALAPREEVTGAPADPTAAGPLATDCWAAGSLAAVFPAVAASTMTLEAVHAAAVAATAGWGAAGACRWAAA